VRKEVACGPREKNVDTPEFARTTRGPLRRQEPERGILAASGRCVGAPERTPGKKGKTTNCLSKLQRTIARCIALNGGKQLANRKKQHRSGKEGTSPQKKSVTVGTWLAVKKKTPVHKRTTPPCTKKRKKRSQKHGNHK